MLVAWSITMVQIKSCSRMKSVTKTARFLDLLHPVLFENRRFFLKNEITVIVYVIVTSSPSSFSLLSLCLKNLKSKSGIGWLDAGV